MGARRVHAQKLVIIGDSGGGNRRILTIGTHLGEPAPLRTALQMMAGRTDQLGRPADGCLARVGDGGNQGQP